MKRLVTRLQQRQQQLRLTTRAQRRLHERVLTAVMLTLTRGTLADALTLGPRRHVVLALTEERVWILDHAWPGTIGGVIADFDRGGTLLHTRRSPFARRHAIELSWPDSHGFVAGTIPASEAADLLIGHLAADELTHR